MLMLMSKCEPALRPSPLVSGYFWIRNFFPGYEYLPHVSGEFDSGSGKKIRSPEWKKIYPQRIRWRVDRWIFFNPMTEKACPVPRRTIGSFSKARRRRWRERHQTRDLMSRTMAVHVHFESWCISLPSCAKQREMTKYFVFWRKRTVMANFWYLLFELNAVGAC